MSSGKKELIRSKTCSDVEDFVIAAAIHEAFNRTKMKMMKKNDREVHHMDSSSAEFASSCPLIAGPSDNVNLTETGSLLGPGNVPKRKMGLCPVNVPKRKMGLCQRQNSDREVICRALKNCKSISLSNYKSMQSFNGKSKTPFRTSASCFDVASQCRANAKSWFKEED